MSNAIDLMDSNNSATASNHPLPSTVVVKNSDETVKTSLFSDEMSDGSDGDDWEPTTKVHSSSLLSAIPETDKPEAPKKKGPWMEPYEPAPVVDQNTVLLWGFLLFALALIWPPCILFFAYVASKIIPYSFRTTDCAVNRRKLFREFARMKDLPEAYRTLPESNEVKLDDSFWTNQRGMLLHTVTMTPTLEPIKAVVFYCHGYVDNVSFEKLLYKQKLVKEGLAFVAIEYEGHGLSDGAMGLISDWNALVEDVTDYMRHVSKKFAGIPMFLMGESMGGAVAYSVQKRAPDLIRGVVFVSPMCKISDNMLPNPMVVDFLKWLIGPSGDDTSWLGYLPIAPAREQMVTHKDPKKLLLASLAPLCFCRNPRLSTARELINATQSITSNLKEFDAPFLVVHGLDDTVTDPQLSQALYDESKSEDKSIKLYHGMWHALMCGEPDENADMVFRDCIDWILQRAED